MRSSFHGDLINLLTHKHALSALYFNPLMYLIISSTFAVNTGFNCLELVCCDGCLRLLTLSLKTLKSLIYTIDLIQLHSMNTYLSLPCCLTFFNFLKHTTHKSPTPIELFIHRKAQLVVQQIKALLQLAVRHDGAPFPSLPVTGFTILPYLANHFFFFSTPLGDT